MDLVDESKLRGAIVPPPRPEISPYLQRRLRSLEEALADLETGGPAEVLRDLAWEALQDEG